MKKEDFYRRQKILKEIGDHGQDLLEGASVLIVGAGGLGNPAATYLAGSGVGHIGICDFDKVEISNLHRQVLFTPSDVGEYKAQVLKNRITSQNPFIKVTDINSRITLENGEEIFSSYDIIIDCCDNFETKFLLHDLSFILKKDLIQSSIYQYEGQLQKFEYSVKENRENGCLRCLWDKTPKKDCVSNCAMAGVVGAVAGTFGSLQAMEAVKSILKINGLKHRQTLIFDLLSLSSQKIAWKHKSDCSFCSNEQSVDLLKKDKSSFEIHELPINEKSIVFDIRESDEISKSPLDYTCVVNSMSKFDESLIATDKEIILVCASGVRSFKLADRLRKSGYGNIYSLSTGIQGIPGA